MSPSNPPKESGPSLYLVAAVLLPISFIAFWETFKYPFIQDDWFIVDALRRSGPLGYLKDILTQPGAVFYRPLGAAWFASGYSLFGMNPVGFHCAAILLHSLSSVLLFYIVYRLTSDKIIAWMSAIIYATAVTVHLDPLAWIVGIYDLGGIFFFLLSIALFINGRAGYSVVTYVAALLMKEAAIILPVVLFSVAIFRLNERSASTVRGAGRNVLPHGIIMAVYVIFRYVSHSGSWSGSESAYKVEFFGSHIFRNAELYASWLADSIAPILATGRSPWIFLAIMLVIFVLVRSSNKERHLFYLLTAWLVIGILPPLVLQNHAFRYYLIYSLPAFVVLCASGLRALATSIISGARGSTRLVALILAVNLVLSALYVFKLDEKGFDAPTVDGSNNLLRKGKLVMMTQEFLATEGTSLPQGSTLLFDWLPTMSFGVSIGPSIWCRDSSITVYEVKYAEGRMHLYDPIHPENVPDIPPLEMGFLLTFHGVKLDMTRLADL